MAFQIAHKTRPTVLPGRIHEYDDSNAVEKGHSRALIIACPLARLCKCFCDRDSRNSIAALDAMKPNIRPSFSTQFAAMRSIRRNPLTLVRPLSFLGSSPPAPAFPVTPSCPAPTCACAETPPGLEIDHEQDLNGTMAPYAQQVVIATGQGDWRSRIEEDGVDEGWGMLGRGVKGLIGRGGRFADVSYIYSFSRLIRVIYDAHG